MKFFDATVDAIQKTMIESLTRGSLQSDAFGPFLKIWTRRRLSRGEQDATGACFSWGSRF
jgi:hypothetical protein